LGVLFNEATRGETRTIVLFMLFCESSGFALRLCARIEFRVSRRGAETQSFFEVANKLARKEGVRRALLFWIALVMAESWERILHSSVAIAEVVNGILPKNRTETIQVLGFLSHWQKAEQCRQKRVRRGE
jgi:hypothetical protein